MEKSIEEYEAERADDRVRIRELEAERDADRKREYGYSQHTVDAAPQAYKMKVDEFVKQMRSLEADHAPNGFPTIQMRDVSRLCSIIERHRMVLKVLSKEAPGLRYLNQFWCRIASEALEEEA